MKQCPKCQANISDTAKFCVKCGCNIKKYEEEQAQAYFCPECGTKFSGGVFCPECGFNVTNELNGQAVLSETETFGDGWLTDLESSSNADVATMKEQKSKEQTEKALSAFEYESHSDGTYTIVSLKDNHALNITVPEGVVAIADHAFEGCEAFSISLPEGLLKIGNAAFKGSADLSSINLPDSLFSVGDEAFAECEMLDIELPASIRKIGKDAIKNTVQDKAQRAKAEAEAKMKAEEARKAEEALWDVGGSPTFGSYYQNNDMSKQPIEWIVLEREGSKALLISKYVLDCKPYNTVAVSIWENSTLRKWLNSEFLKEAFNSEELKKIQITKVYDDTLGRGYRDCGNPTNDMIFLLSMNEAPCLETTALVCVPTAFAVSQGAYRDKNGYTDWCLRTPGEKPNLITSVTCDGKVNTSGTNIRALDFEPPSCYGVRPALWIDLEA